MPLYKFYRIVPKDVSKTDCYIGHTIQPLRKRFTAHGCSKNTSCRQLFERYGKDNLQIVLIHELELPTVEEARREERRLYEEVAERAVNQVLPYRSQEELKVYQQTYRINHRETVKTQHRLYYDANKEQLKAKQKAYYDANKERWRAYAIQRKAFFSGLKYFARITIE